MKSTALRVLVNAVFLAVSISTVVRAQCPTGDSTRTANLNSTFQWSGPTASTVTVTQLTTNLNSLGEQVVVSETNIGAEPFQITKDSCTLIEEISQRWHKNGGHTGNGTSVNNYIARIQLTFSNPVPAKEVFIAIIDMRRRGVASVVPDGYIKFNVAGVHSAATPAKFKMVSLARGGNQMLQVNGYNTDGIGGIDFGIPETDTTITRCIGIMSDDAATVSAINIFVRNISDDVGFYVGAVNLPSNPLGLDLIHFSGKNTNNGNLLNWATVHETNMSKFVVERSYNGEEKSFETVGNVAASNSQEYQFIDENNFQSKSFYRLKMVENDGNYTYSPVIAIENKKAPTNVQLIPNPLIGNRFQIINGAKIEEVKLYDLSGRMIDNVTFEPTESGANVSVNTALLSKGLYIVAYKSAGNVVGKTKLLVQ